MLDFYGKTVCKFLDSSFESDSRYNVLGIQMEELLCYRVSAN